MPSPKDNMLAVNTQLEHDFDKLPEFCLLVREVSEKVQNTSATITVNKMEWLYEWIK